MRDVPWENTFKLSPSTAASEFCDWVHIPDRKYQDKPHSSPWFSATCAAAIAHRNHYFRLYLEAAKLAYANKTKDSITSKKLGSQDFRQITKSVLNKGKSTITFLFNGLEVLSSDLIKQNYLLKTFLITLILMTHSAWKVCKYGDFSGPYFSVFTPNTGKYRPEKKIHIWISLYLFFLLKLIWNCIGFL